MIVTTSENIPNCPVTHIIGVVTGNVIQPEHAVQNRKTSTLQGELEAYAEALSKARAIATERMQREASDLHADAIINVRCSTSSVPTRATEILVYGTAVKTR